MFDDERFRPVLMADGGGSGLGPEGNDAEASGGDGEGGDGAVGPGAAEASEPWHAGLSLDADISKWLVDKGYDSPQAAFAAHREIERWQGRAIELPGADAPPELWDRIYNRLGRPDRPEGYDVDFGEGIGEQEKAHVLSALHGLGLTRKQVEGLYQFQVERIARARKAADIARNSAIDEDFRKLDAEWGGDKDRNDEIAKRAVRALGLEAAELDLLGEAMKSHAAIWRVMRKVGQRLGEDRSIGRAESRLAASRSEALSKIESIRADGAHPYNNERHPGHQAAVAVMQDLHRVAYPDDDVAA